MEFPVEVELAQPAPILPTGPHWWYEIKLDGHRTVLWRTAEAVRLQSRSGRDVTTWWTDVAADGMALPPGVVLDGEVVIVVDGRISFEAVQSRAASSPARARRLAQEHPALLVVWDVLALPSGDVRGRPYEWRRAAMLDVLAGLPSPSRLQAVSATEELEVAQAWYDSLRDTGVEGVVAKLGTSPYRAGRSAAWQKIKHAETVDAEVVGYTGAPLQPRMLAVRLPDGRTALSQRLDAPLAAQVAPDLGAAPPAGQAETAAGDAYTAAEPGLTVEVLASSAHRAAVTVTRLR
ncbi:DNA ligase [Streptomyces sp. V3I7]|uniref:ATP-dependent DNA ligase n=1 Tax=Streptomyces sp. V3I7 TaxID=3042278 RepID=UPI0027D7DDD8|nr:DNA ligase [Streptomyces sp. V3I7]